MQNTPKQYNNPKEFADLIRNELWEFIVEADDWEQRKEVVAAVYEKEL